ncbi:MAG: response regulator [Reichenbachiella sp.]
MRRGIVYLLILVSQNVIAQPNKLLTKNIYFEQLEQELGLSHQTINCVLQDYEGYLWIATWSGLIKYDGYSTKVFRADNKLEGYLRSNKVVNLFESSDSTLWVCTRTGGLYRKSKGRDYFKQYTHDPNDPHSISNIHVWSMAEDLNGGLWVGTELGLNHFDPKTEKFKSWVQGDSVNTLSQSFITSLITDDKGQLWVGTEFGVNLLRDGTSDDPKFERIFYYEDSEYMGLHNYIYGLTYFENSGQSAVYWVTKMGLKKYSDGALASYEWNNKPSGFNLFRCLVLVESNDPIILVGSDRGLSMFNIKKSQFENFTGDSDKVVNLSQNTITSLLFDSKGILWAGTKKGLNKYDSYDNNIALIKTNDFDSTNSMITGANQLVNGDIWISTLGGGLFRFDDNDGRKELNRYKIRIEGEVDFSDFIQKLNIDHEGNVWVGTAGAGLYVFDPKYVDDQTNEIRVYKSYNSESESGIFDNYIMSLSESNSGGGMWVGTWSKGFFLINPLGEVIAFDDPRIMDKAIMSIQEGENGVLWLGTMGSGMIKVKIQNYEIVEYEEYKFRMESAGISNNFIGVIFVDSNHNLWVGTEDGLNMYNKKENRFELLNEKYPLLPKDVVSIVEDRSGLLWLATYDGVTLIDLSKEDLYVNHFDTKDRIQGGIFINGVGILLQNDQVLLGGSNGLNLIDPKDITQNSNHPNVVIDKVLIENKELMPDAITNGRVIIDKSINLIDTIYLDHSEDNISFEFTALHFANPGKVQYSYKLDGFDQEWNYTNAERRFARYTNMGDGVYVFYVKATNDDGIWSENSCQLTVVIAPPWWKTNWAIFGYVFLVLLFLALFRKLIFIRLNYEHDLKFERLEKENNEKLNKSRLQFFTNISHEFRTPLTLITGLVQQIMSQGKVGPHIQKQLKGVSLNTNRLERLINQLLDFRKAEYGSLKLRVAQGNFYKFVKEVKLSFDNLAEQRNIYLEFETSSNVIQAYFDRDQFEKIIFNLLSNAFKHSPEGATIKVQLSELEGTIILSVIDEGGGIAPDVMKHIFDRFYSGDQDTGTGSGIGLALSKSLVTLHHGEITAENNDGKGAKFEVRIPKGKEHFEEEEIIIDFEDSDQVGLYQDVLVMNNEGGLGEDLMPPAHKDVSNLKRILLVEDNVEVRQLIKSLFQYDYAVFEAENGKEGLELAKENNPDLIISDVMMPVMDGFSLCKAIKKDLETSHIPVILLTARTSYIYNIEGLDKGADDYITKPFHIEILKLKVKNLIEARDQVHLMIEKSGHLKLEPKMITVTSADELFVQKSIEIIEEHMGNSEYTVVGFGKEIGLSRMQLYRKLKTLTGKSPNEFIRMMRIKRSAQLLRTGGLNVSEVAYQVGFTDPAYFRKCFKEQFGQTPISYVKLSKK